VSDTNDSDQGPKPKEAPSGGNVIRFPIEKVKGKNRLKRLAGKLGDNKKSTLFLSLLSVLVMSFYLLQINSGGQREIASSVDNRDWAKEKALSQTLGDTEKRWPASYGRKPTAEERLREQDLNRGYQLRYNGHDGLVIEAVHLDSEGDGEMFEPVTVKDPVEFLMRHRQAISPGYDRVEQDQSGYVLLRDGVHVGRVFFKLDELGRLIQMKVQVLETP